MKDEPIYEPLTQHNFERIITTYEHEIARIKGELERTAPTSPAERDRQHILWHKLDSLGHHLANLRDQVLTIHVS